MGFNSAFKGLKLLKKNPGNGRLNNLNDPLLNVLIFSFQCYIVSYTFCHMCLGPSYLGIDNPPSHQKNINMTLGVDALRKQTPFPLQNIDQISQTVLRTVSTAGKASSLTPWELFVLVPFLYKYVSNKITRYSDRHVTGGCWNDFPIRVYAV